MASRMTPSKRPFQKNSSDHNGRGKWQKTKNSSAHKSQPKIEPGVPIFRILCPASKSGNVIGKKGGIIAKIRQETGVKIRVDKAVLDCNERVIFISAKDDEASSEHGGENGRGVAVSAGGVHEKDKVTIKEEKDDQEENHCKEEKHDLERDHSNEEKDDAERDDSKEQKDDSEKENSKEDKDDDSQKGHIKEEKDDDSEKGHIIKEEKDDEKDALEKDHIKEEKDGTFVAKEMKSEPERVVPSALKAVLFVLDRIFAAEDDNETGDASGASTSVSLRLLVLYSQAGWLLGKGGSVVKQMSADNGCEIRVLKDKLPVCALPNDRLCQHPGDGISPAQNAILHVQRKLMLPASDKEGPAMCRLIISPNQVGCLMGKGGSVIAEMRKLSGAFIIVLSKDKVPRGVPEHDEVIQISGGCDAIQEALMQITARLRNHLFRDRMPAMGPNMRPPFGSLDSQFGPYAGNHESPSMFHKDFMGRQLDGISAPWTVKGMRDVSDTSDIPGTGHREFGGFSGPGQSSMMPNLTVEVLVPRLVIPALCTDGGCLDRIREFSEAKITVAEPIVDAMDTTVLISGTPDQMHAARSLVQAFIISESFAT
nr:unnamed protein product [Digitaria exilis]